MTYTINLSNIILSNLSKTPEYSASILLKLCFCPQPVDGDDGGEEEAVDIGKAGVAIDRKAGHVGHLDSKTGSCSSQNNCDQPCCEGDIVRASWDRG